MFFLLSSYSGSQAVKKIRQDNWFWVTCEASLTIQYNGCNWETTYHKLVKQRKSSPNPWNIYNTWVSRTRSEHSFRISMISANIWMYIFSCPVLCAHECAYCVSLCKCSRSFLKEKIWKGCDPKAKSKSSSVYFKLPARFARSW